MLLSAYVILIQTIWSLRRTGCWAESLSDKLGPTRQRPWRCAGGLGLAAERETRTRSHRVRRIDAGTATLLFRRPTEANDDDLRRMSSPPVTALWSTKVHCQAGSLMLMMLDLLDCLLCTSFWPGQVVQRNGLDLEPRTRSPHTRARWSCSRLGPAGPSLEWVGAN